MPPANLRNAPRHSAQRPLPPLTSLPPLSNRALVPRRSLAPFARFRKMVETGLQLVECDKLNVPSYNACFPRNNQLYCQGTDATEINSCINPDL